VICNHANDDDDDNGNKANGPMPMTLATARMDKNRGLRIEGQPTDAPEMMHGVEEQCRMRCQGAVAQYVGQGTKGIVG
jgi:hypothetical protein